MARALTLLLHIPLLQNRTYIKFMQKPIRVLLVGFACGNYTPREVHKRSGKKFGEGIVAERKDGFLIVQFEKVVGRK